MTRQQAEMTLRTWQRAANNSVSAWRYWQQWQEMMTASTATIGLRLGAIGQDLSRGVQPESAEIGRMWQEKNVAFNQGSLALVQWQEAWLQQLWRQWQKGIPAAAASGLTATQWLASANQWMAMWFKGASGTIAPYHSKSTANARRLGKKTYKQ